MECPYWLLHEEGKTAGFGIVAGEAANTPEEAKEAWAAGQGAEFMEMFPTMLEGTTARLITTPFTP